jgi:phosphotransacetylase
MSISDTIMIPVDADLARAYAVASPEEKEKIQTQLEQVLRAMLPESQRTLQSVVHELSQKAKERGMTPEILEELLRDDE